MIIAINTATNITTLELHDATGNVLQNDIWESGRQLSDQLFEHMETLLSTQSATMKDLSGIVVFRGPGSFTGLRIGITVANTVAYASSTAIVGEIGKSWIENGLKRLAAQGNDVQVVPHYGATATTTKPKGMP